MQAPNSFLLIDSLDRYTTKGGTLGTQNNLAEAAFFADPNINTCATFTIENPGALINGYMKKLTVSQIQVDYRIPTITDRNDTIVIYHQGTDTFAIINIPIGFYTPLELAAVLQVLIGNEPGFENFRCNLSYFNEQPTVQGADTSGTIQDPAGNLVYKVELSSTEFPITRTSLFCDNYQSAQPGWTFVNPVDVPVYATNPTLRQNIFRTYRTLGITRQQCLVPDGTFGYDEIYLYPLQLLYTPYVDIQSFALTQYQTIKDTDTSTAKKAGLIARIYLSGTAGPESLTPTGGIGTTPFWMTADLNNCKVIEWTRDVNVTNLDFRLFDQYGEPIYWTPEFATEFQLSLLVSE